MGLIDRRWRNGGQKAKEPTNRDHLLGREQSPPLSDASMATYAALGRLATNKNNRELGEFAARRNHVRAARAAADERLWAEIQAR